MIKLTASGAGGSAEGTVRDTNGVGLLPVQAQTDGTVFRVLGRVSPEAPWIEVKEPSAAAFLESISWVPYVRLEITSGAGTVALWVGEQ